MDLQRGDDSRRNWIKINEQAAALRTLNAEVSRLREAVQALRRPKGDEPTDRFPFRTYWLPNTRRTTADPNAWRKFYVQHGYVNYVKTDGCDDTDEEGTTPTEIIVPDVTPEYFIWAEIALTSGEVFTAAIDHGETGWASFPTQPDLPDTYYALIARVDTATFADEERPIIRQFVFQDIFLTPSSGAGGDPRWA